MSPRGWHIPGQVPGTQPKGGRRPKGGARIAVRLGPEATEALDRLRAAGRTTTEVVEAALIAADSAAPPR